MISGSGPRAGSVWVEATGWVVTATSIAMLVVVPMTARRGPPSPAPQAAALAPAVAVPAAATAPAGAPVTTLGASPPRTLRIAAIGVSTTVVDVGLNADHTLQVPPLTFAGTHEAAWYDRGPAPGQAGDAVIVGHVDSTSGPGVFYKLGSLVPGDSVAVTRANGTTATFTVTAVAEYPKDRFPTQQVYGTASDAELRLVTCGGTFDRSTGHYLSNIVAYATLT